MKITPDLLKDTLNIITLTREIALEQGNESQAERLAPIESGIRNLITSTQISNNPSRGVLAETDFQTLLKTLQNTSTADARDNAERFRIIEAMIAGGMEAPEIARHIGITREEVDLIIGIGKRNNHSKEVNK